MNTLFQFADFVSSFSSSKANNNKKCGYPFSLFRYFASDHLWSCPICSDAYPILCFRFTYIPFSLHVRSNLFFFSPSLPLSIILFLSSSWFSLQHNLISISFFTYFRLFFSSSHPFFRPRDCKLDAEFKFAMEFASRDFIQGRCGRDFPVGKKFEMFPIVS